jgi:hypothetical protein
VKSRVTRTAVAAVLIVGVAAAVDFASRRISELLMTEEAQPPLVTMRRPGTSENFVYNGDFEHGLNAWNWGGASAQVIDHGQSGKCLQLTGDGSPSQFAIAWNVARLELHQTYRFSFWVKSGASGGQKFLAGIWAARSHLMMGSQEGQSTAHWTQHVVTFTNTVPEPISVELMRVMPGRGDLLFDSIQLRPMKPNERGE